MTTDFRVLCFELSEALCGYTISQDDCLLVAHARALLAQQEPQPPAAGEVAELVRWLRREATEAEADGWPDYVGPLARAADLLQHQHPQPVPVSERLPGPEDCDDGGYCWWWRTDKAEEWWEFLYLRDARDHNRRCGSARYTHWLPYHAIPNLPNPND